MYIYNYYLLIYFAVIIMNVSIGILIARSFFRRRVPDLVPIARNRIIESMDYGIIVLDSKNRIVDINPSARHIYQCNINVIGKRAEECFKLWPDLIEIILKNKEHIEYKNLIIDEDQYYDASCLPIKNDKENIIGRFIIIQDVTERKLTNQKLLEEQKESAVREEREKLARDLESNIAQMLAFINVQSQAITEYVKNGQQQTAFRCIERLTEIAQDAHSNLREAILIMRGEKISMEKGMAELLTELNMQLEFFKKSYGINMKLEYKAVEGFDFADSKIVFQVLNIIKESINNIAKHSRASSANISFVEDDDCMYISIKDNGCGFDIGKVFSDNKNKYGIKFMKERVAEIGADLDIFSAYGKGTEIRLRVPVKVR